MTEGDLAMLCEWLKRPHLQQWWHPGQQTMDEIRGQYLPVNRSSDDAWPFIAEHRDEAIGYIQYYDAHAGNNAWWPDRLTPGVIGIDQFLADETRLDQGLGTRMTGAFCQWLFDEVRAREIRVDPNPDNARAIACYRKVGFRPVAEITTPEGPALMMTLAKQDLARQKDHEHG